jgi:hypothetical protein
MSEEFRGDIVNEVLYVMSGQRAAAPPGGGSRSGREARSSRLTFAGSLSQMAFADDKPHARA